MGIDIKLVDKVLAIELLHGKAGAATDVKSPEKMIKVLLVEDSPEDSLFITDLLEEACEHNCNLVIDNAVNFANAEGLLRQHDYDLAIIDYMLGFKTGLDLLQRIKSKDLATPVIFVTGQGNEKIAADAMKNGANDYIVKDDLDTSLVMKIVDKYLLKKSSRDLLSATKMLFASHGTQDTLDWNIFQSVDKAFQLEPRAHFIKAKSTASNSLNYKFFMNLDHWLLKV